MNKQELIEIIAEKSHTTKSDSKKMLDAFLETVTETLAQGDSVQLVGFGTFKTSDSQTSKHICLNATFVLNSK